MECKGDYFRVVEGELICVRCGKKAAEHRGGKIEDKAEKRPETKTAAKTARR